MKLKTGLNFGITLFLTAIPLIGQDRAPLRPPETPRSTDAVENASGARGTERSRPEQKLTDKDQSGLFKAASAQPSSGDLSTQPDEGNVKGFDLSRDPLNAREPNQDPEAIKKADIAAKASITAAQRKLLESRYDL